MHEEMKVGKNKGKVKSQQRMKNSCQEHSFRGTC